MASHVLYPPTIAPSLPAFLADQDSLRVPISFSKFNSRDDFKSAHISITKKDTGMNVVNTVENDGRCRATGIILNAEIESEINSKGETDYFVRIYKDDLKASSFKTEGTGWIPGWFYKIQVRLSEKNYRGNAVDGGQQQWLNQNASNFSEWSTVCILKAIGDITIDVTNFDFKYTSSTSNYIQRTQTYGNTLAFIGNFECTDMTEILAYYRLKLYKFPKEDNPIPLEDTGYIYNTAVNLNEFNYNFKSRLQDGSEQYVIEVEYNTLNNYSDIFRINFTLSQVVLDDTTFILTTVEQDPNETMKGLTSLGDEEENGRIGLKIYDLNDTKYSGNLCICRASSRDNFLTWDDIKILTFKNQNINECGVIYDYTAESGVWYKYGIQSIKGENSRSKLNIITKPVMRNFDYAYLLGENNQQLKLSFNNTLNSMTRNISDAHLDTLGGKYAVFSRNAVMDYRSFPIEGLISFWMDEQNTFTDKKVIYGNDDIIELYDNYNEEHEIRQYDYIYEREFRQMVSDFLHDGKPKLFKSTTEGNIIIRITDVSLSPDDSLGRLISSFSGTAYELDDNTVDNYKKYNLLTVGEIEEDLSISDLKIGQLYTTIKPNQNVFKLIYDKYYQENLLGSTHKVSGIQGVKIQIDAPPMRVLNNAQKFEVGYNIEIDEHLITLKGDKGYYEFEPDMVFTPFGNKLFIKNDADNTISELPVVIDFLFEEKVAPYEAKKVTYQMIHRGVGQEIGNFKAGTDFYKKIYNKYYFDWKHQFSKLVSLDTIEIEAAPGAVFEFRDEMDIEPERHIMNATGVLYLSGISEIKSLKYLGVDSGYGLQKVNTDIIINYYYSSQQGGYQ